MSYQWRVSLYVVIIQNVVQHSGEGDLILFGKIPLRDDFKRSLTYPCPRSLLESRIALRIKHS